MNKKRTGFSLSLALSLSLASFGAVASELYSERSVYEGHEVWQAEARFAEAIVGDLYVIATVNGVDYFMTGTGFAEQVTPYRTGVLNERIPLLAVSLPGVVTGSHAVHQVVTVPGGDPYNVRDWQQGFSELDRLGLNVGMPRKSTGDRDGDGWADDDRNRDGYHDDDRDYDGYHDDDRNRDGYHDDDRDFDGYHDDDWDRDGYRDDDRDFDGYHDDDRDRDGYRDDDRYSGGDRLSSRYIDNGAYYGDRYRDDDDDDDRYYYGDGYRGDDDDDRYYGDRYGYFDDDDSDD